MLLWTTPSELQGSNTSVRVIDIIDSLTGEILGEFFAPGPPKNKVLSFGDFGVSYAVLDDNIIIGAHEANSFVPGTTDIIGRTGAVYLYDRQTTEFIRAFPELATLPPPGDGSGSIPEPTTLTLMALGLAGIGYSRRKTLH